MRQSSTHHRHWLALAGALFLTSPRPALAQRTGLEVSVDLSKVDLSEHRLEVRMNRPASKVTIKVLTEAGAVIAESEQDASTTPAGQPIVVTWSPSTSETPARIELFGHDKLGFYKGVAIVPWSVTIPHEEVTFRTDSSDIDASEQPKLEASLTKIQASVTSHKALGAIRLFIAGHTDTVGPAPYNLNLSRMRAQAIARWFSQRGLKTGIAFEGFGEASPLVRTADEVDEPRNRRVDYILSVNEPVIKATGFVAGWKVIR